MTILSDIPSDWWKSAVLYQIYPRSFYDANNDGIGDLKGITSKLDYLNDGKGNGLGVDGIWLSPFYKSPMKDFGYDVSDYLDVDPIFGTLDDFDELIAHAHSRGIKILVDLVLNHSSDLHPWFLESKTSRDNPKADWYLWVDKPGHGGLPNNWLSVFGGSAWEYCEERDQYYYHSFLKEQPDFNWYNPEVQAAMETIITFWCRKGVDGFRLDTANFYAHDQQLRDNPEYPSDHQALEEREGVEYDSFNNCYSKDRPENFDCLKLIRRSIEKCSPHITTIGEIGGIQDLDELLKLASSYVHGSEHLHMAYTFSLLGSKTNSMDIATILGKTEKEIGDGWPCWSFGNHDCVRVRTRSENSLGKVEFYQNLMLLLLCFRGTPIIYYGDELGVEEYKVKKEDLQDPFGIAYWPDYPGRDGCRTPFPWELNHPSQGFNSGQTSWLPTTSPVALMKDGVLENPMFELTREMIAFRKSQPALQTGSYNQVAANPSVFAFQRTLDNERVFIACNFSGSQQELFVGDDWQEKTLNHFTRNGKLDGLSLDLPPYGFSLLVSKQHL